jgi:hypothetical protein
MSEWHGIEKALRRQRPTGSMSAPDDFWAGFRARADGLAQMPAPPRTPATAIRVSALALCAAFLAFGALTYARRDTAEAGFNRVTSVEVDPAHSAVFIMNDAPTHSTIVWVVYRDADDTDERTL